MVLKGVGIYYLSAQRAGRHVASCGSCPHAGFKRLKCHIHKPTQSSLPAGCQMRGCHAAKGSCLCTLLIGLPLHAQYRLSIADYRLDWLRYHRNIQDQLNGQVV